jgi:hypothetical protein
MANYSAQFLRDVTGLVQALLYGFTQKSGFDSDLFLIWNRKMNNSTNNEAERRRPGRFTLGDDTFSVEFS